MTHEQLVERVTELVDRYDPTRHEPYNTARAILSLIADALGEPTEGMYSAATKLENFCAVHNYGGSPDADSYWHHMLGVSPLKPDSQPPVDGV